MSKRAPRKHMFSLSKVSFRNSAIAGRGVFAKARFAPGDLVVAYAPEQRRLEGDDPEAIAAADTKLTLLSEGWYVIIPDTRVPGGWLCNHSCNPNSVIYSSGAGRIQCERPIAPGEEITIFYGWVTRDEPERDPCLCGSPRCRGTINFDVSTVDARNAELETAEGMRFRKRLAEYVEFLRSIGQEQVEQTIASAIATAKD